MDNLQSELRTRRQEEVREPRSSLEQELADTKRELELRSQDLESAFTELECLRELKLQLMREQLQLSDSLETGRAAYREQSRMLEDMRAQMDSLLSATCTEDCIKNKGATREPIPQDPSVLMEA